MSMNLSSSENATISSKISSVSFFDSPRIDAFMKTFSRPGELVVESRTELEQRGHPPSGDDLAPGGLQDAGDALEQRRLAAPVVPEDPDGRARLDVEVDRPSGP